MSSTEQCPVNDVYRVGPSDGRRRLQHVDRDGFRSCVVVGRVGWRKRQRERLAATGAQHGPGRGRVNKDARYRGGGVEMRSAERGPVGDVRRIGPGDGRSGFQYIDGHALRCRVVVGRIGRRESNRERLPVASSQHGSCGWRVCEGACYRGGGIQLRAAERGPVADVRRVGPHDSRGGLQYIDRHGLRCRVVVGRIGRGEGNRERLAIARVKNSSSSRRVDKAAR